jgi:hypothetical protein
MTLEEFYAQALLTTFPLAVRESPCTPEASGKAKVVQVANEYAAELTACFKATEEPSHTNSDSRPIPSWCSRDCLGVRISIHGIR